MTIQQVQYLLEVARTRSISKAAANLFLTQPHVSSSIRALERELGCKIFVRTNRGIRVTEQGTAVLQEAGKIYDSYQNMLRAQKAEPGSCFRVGGLSYCPMRRAFCQLCVENESQGALNYAYTVLAPSKGVEQVFLSMLDLYVTLVHPDDYDEMLQVTQKKGLCVEEVAKLPIVIRIGPKHRLYHQKEVDLSSFKQDILICHSGVSQTARNLQFNDLKAIIDPGSVVMVSDRDSKIELLRNSALMYSISCQQPHLPGEDDPFREIPVHGAYCILVAVTNGTVKQNPLIVRYLSLLRQWLQQLPALQESQEAMG